MTTELTPYYRRFLEKNSPELFNPNPWMSCSPVVYPPKNEFDVDINRSNNDTNISLANIFEKINKENNLHQEELSREFTKQEKIRAGKESLIEAIRATPGKSTWDMTVNDEERGFFFKRKPSLFEIHIR